MWIMLNNSFLSIVDNSKVKGDLLVRSRRKGDIEKVFPAAEVFSLSGRDYAYRASIPRTEVAAAMSAQVMGINYPNFKDSVSDDRLHSAYARVWGVMAGVQEIPPFSMRPEGKAAANTSAPKMRTVKRAYYKGNA